MVLLSPVFPGLSDVTAKNNSLFKDAIRRKIELNKD